MIITNSIYENMFNSAAREFVGRVELLEGSTLLDIFEHNGALQSFTVERIGDNTRFFGYGVCQQITVKLRDKDRAINIQKGQRLQAAFGIGKDYLYTCPVYIIDEVARDENTNDLTIKAYDPMYQGNNHRVKELVLPETYTLKTFAYACGSVLGMPVDFINVPDSLLNIQCTKNNTNLSGDETVREVLDDLAEMFGAVYYFCNNWRLTFKHLDVDGEPVAAIDKSKYFELTARTAHTLTNIASVTELGDNVSTTSGMPGEIQYFRENAFLTLRDDIGSILNTVLNEVQGLTFHQFDCKHRGDFRMEIGDKVSLETKDGSIIHSYILNDKITYHGGLEGQTTLEYAFNEAEVETAPATLGDALKQTHARVDKVNQTITLLANDMDERIASLVLTTDQIQATVRDNTQGLQSQITQTADSIRSEVTDQVNGLNSQLEQTAGSLTSTITDTKNELQSQLTQTAGSLTSTITDTKNELQSQINQTADSITSSVTDEINQAKSEIKQTTDSISLEVQNQGDLVAQLVLDVDGISARGYVTFTDLEGNGTTTINGSNITTGTIDADRINMTGAISWSDLSSSCKNTIASYAGSDGSDADVPDYIHETYIDATDIYSPNIYGAKITAGTASEGYIQMAGSGLNYYSKTGGSVLGIGYYPGKWNYPYIVLGQGVDSAGTDKGMIKKYSNGIWIGDSDSMSSDSPSAYSIGIFIDFTNGKLYRYNGSGTRAELV